MTASARTLDAIKALAADQAFGPLKALVIETTGMAFYADKDEELARIIHSRLEETGRPGCAAYLALLGEPGAGAAEMEALIAELTIGETYFFRHKEQFDALRATVLDDVIARNAETRRLRIWSAGCATGPEPYSLAIMLKREFGARIAGWHVSIIGTDINQKFLARAREGRYDDWAFRSVPDEIRRGCFDHDGRKWQIRPEYKQLVTFQYHNLIKGSIPSLVENIAAFDIIICRNVVIYFSPETIRALIPRFRECLTDGGWLIMGHAEPNPDLFRSFRTVNLPGAVLYQKQDQAAPAAPMSRPAANPSQPFPSQPLPYRTPPPQPAPAQPLPAQPLPAHPPPTRAPLRLPGSPPGAGRPVAPPKSPAGPPGPDGEAVGRMRALADSGQWEAAIKACDRLLAGDGLNARLHFYRSLVLEQMGALDEGERALRRAIYLDRRLVLPHYHLGLVLWRRDDAQGAARSFRNVLALLDGYPDTHVFGDGDGDGISAGQLRETVGMHLGLIGGA